MPPNPQGVVRYLDSIGLLSPRLTAAHGVWLRPDEIELGWPRAASPSRSTPPRTCACAPASRRSAPSSRPASTWPWASTIWRSTTMTTASASCGWRTMSMTASASTGADCPGGGRCALPARQAIEPSPIASDIGHLKPGAPADFVVLDYARLAADASDSADPLQLVLGRATARDVTTLVVGGRMVMAASKSGLVRPRRGARRAHGAGPALGRAHRRRTGPFLAGLRGGMKSFYDSGTHRKAG